MTKDVWAGLVFGAVLSLLFWLLFAATLWATLFC